ncbi:putative Salicylate hydroxylase [Glarea lozoyensis 74030]|uniref:Putative Salicylate hydroxylase n=1 Tax=Glarea lozoyensis (strain ATCC 74030 / MF5533) TaxID=1104152 RepID=H0EQ68_GLAL7|nr:putative Salicylate hydroxylase [Glarea lozoyensis 74030]
MSSTDQSFSLAIIGSGIGGLALAIGLLKQNVRCTVYEAAPVFDAVGAGIGLGPNSLKAMALMDEEFAKMYDDIKVGNTAPERYNEQIEILGAEEGFRHGGSVRHPDFTRSSAHRRALLEVMKSLIPEGTVKFNKRVVSLVQKDSKVSIEFTDGEKVIFDAVIGCDGIKGMTRREVLESRYPEEVPAKYCNEYVYRGITTMENAKAIIGTYAEDARWFMMPNKGWAMYPISGGKEVNIVVFVNDDKPWVGEQAARPVEKEEMLRELEGFDKRLIGLLEYVKPMRWPLFHHPDTPTYVKERICLLGDVAHASSPNQAAGAGQGLEDALVLSRVLGLVKNASELDAAFEVYDLIRRPRAQKVVQESKDVGDIYFLTHPDFGTDLEKITEDANRRLPLIWWYDLEADVKIAEEEFRKKVARLPTVGKGSAEKTSKKKTSIFHPMEG